MTEADNYKISKKDCENILKISSSFEFTPRCSGKLFFEGWTEKISKFRSLIIEDDQEFRGYILNLLPNHLKHDVYEIQIQKYTDGGNISIHRDTFPTFVDVCVLKSNPKNGIYIYDRENSNWNFVPDVVGNIIRIKPHEYHCIPKVYGERYSMVFVRRLDFVSQFQKCER